MRAIVNVEMNHVSFIEVTIPEWRLTPVIISDLFPDFAGFAANREVPIVRAVAQRDVFDRVPEVLLEGRISQETPVLILAQQPVTAIRNRGGCCLIRLGMRRQHPEKERDCDDWKHASRIHFCNRFRLLNKPQSSESSTICPWPGARSVSNLFADRRVDLGNVATRKLHESRISVIRGVGSDQDRGSCHLRLCESIGQVRNFVSGCLLSVRIRNAESSHEYGYFAEGRLDSNASIGVARTPDLDARCADVIGDHFAMREGQETAKESRHSIGGHIDSVCWNGLERCIRRRGRMPVKLRIHSAGPLDDRISSDRILKRRDNNISAGCTSGADRLIHIRYEIAGSFLAERMRNRCGKAEYGHSPHRSKNQLRYCAARGRSHSGDAPLRGCAAECRDQTGDETVEVFRSNIDMRCIVLRPYGHAYGCRCLRSVGKTSDVRRSNRETERQN